MSIKISRPKAIVVDIEGTTTDKKFVGKTLFPMLRSRLDSFLDQTYDTPETSEMIRKLKRLTADYPEMPIIVVGSKQQVIASVIENLRYQMKAGVHSTALKSIEMLFWLWAYEKDLFKAHVYDDVSPNLHVWKTQFGIKIYTFSSGLALAQKMLLVNTIHGNVYSLIEEFFDNSVGSKTDVESYKKISNRIGVEVNNILFITDDPKEAKTAITAGLKSVIIKRSGNKATNEFPEIQRIQSFSGIKF